MRRSPSIVPDHDVYLVLSRFDSGLAWCETDEEDTDRETVIRDLMEGQYRDPVRVVSFNIVEGWSRDVTDEIADGLRQRIDDEVPASLLEFLDQH